VAEWLEKRPKKEIISKFLGIIYSKNSWLPIVFQEETPPVVIDGISFDSIQNRVARIMTKISLLLPVESESKKLGIWNQLQPQWTEKYILETKILVRIEEAIAKQLDEKGYEFVVFHNHYIPPPRSFYIHFEDKEEGYGRNSTGYSRKIK
jgi:hypothetical protein